MNKNNQNLALNSRSDLLKILEFLPHSKILINLTLINKFFNQTIKDFPIFTNYTLKFDCGRRGSFIGREKRGFVDNNGNLKSRKNPEVIINDKQKIILITTNNKPLKSLATREAIIQISKTSISKIYFRSYRIPQPIENMSALSAPNSANTSPYQPDIMTTFQNKLPSIKESSHHSKLNRISGPPPAASSGTGRGRARFISAGTNEEMHLTLEECNGHVSNSLTAPSPTSSTYSTNSSVRLSSSINSDVVDLSFTSSSSARSTVRMSGMSMNSNLEREEGTQFETLLDILKTAPFKSLTIGEECVSWSWKDVMLCMQYFGRIKHLSVRIGFERESMPYIKSEQKWLDFIGQNYLYVQELDSLWCNDDIFLRCITSLGLYRNLGKNLNFIEDSNKVSEEMGYEKGSLLKNRLKAISTGNESDGSDGSDGFDTLGGHYYKKNKNVSRMEMCALSYIRYRCDAPNNELSGIEFDGTKIFELTPYDGMFITIPQSVVSFRISIGGSFYEEPDEYKIVIPLSNTLKELCIYEIHNMDKLEGLYHLKSLEYLVIRKKPKNREIFMKYLNNLCKYAPIKQITLMFNAPKYIKNAKNIQSDYWYNLHNLNVNESIINIKHNYYIPNDIPQIIHTQFSDYKFK